MGVVVATGVPGRARLAIGRRVLAALLLAAALAVTISIVMHRA